MTLHKYELHHWTEKGTIKYRSMSGFEEKPKIYLRSTGMPQKVKKDDIGRVVTDGFAYQLILTGRDDEKAIQMIKDAIQNDIDEKEREWQQKKARLERKRQTLKVEDVT